MPIETRTAPQFPQFEKLFEAGSAEVLLRRVERTRKQLNEIAARPSSAAEQTRARTAFDAYTRALALVREVAEVRQKLTEEGATPAAAKR